MPKAPREVIDKSGNGGFVQHILARKADKDEQEGGEKEHDRKIIENIKIEIHSAKNVNQKETQRVREDSPKWTRVEGWIRKVGTHQMMIDALMCIG